MNKRWIRTQMVFGSTSMEKLYQAKVGIFGIGGVGSFAVEALARSGIGHFILVDHDTISESNINRQIHALTNTIGCYKVDVMKERILSINPNAQVSTYREFYLPNSKQLIEDNCSYIIDAVDTVTTKIELVLQAKRLHIPIISSMGTGNKKNPSMLEIADIYETSICPLAKVMRKELKKRGIESCKVVYSKEPPIACKLTEQERIFYQEESEKRNTPGSVSFVPSVAGLLIASEVIKSIAEE